MTWVGWWMPGTALLLDWSAKDDGVAGSPQWADAWRSLAAGFVAVAAGAGLGWWLGVGMPPEGSALLGAGLLGCVGLVDGAEAVALNGWGPAVHRGLLMRTLATAAGAALMGTSIQALSALLVGVAAGRAAALAGVSRTGGSRQILRLLAGLALIGVCVVTFRGVP